MAWFTEDDLRTAAGEASFERGRDYVPEVGELRPTALGVCASVRGKDVYEVWLGRENEGLVGDCQCPYGLEGNFCKHCVAVGLVVLADGTQPREADLETYLQTLDQQELVGLLLEQARRDATLYRQLMLRAGTTGTPQVAVLRRHLEEALKVKAFVDADYVARAKDVLDTVQALVDAGHAAEARPLARHAVELLASAMGAVDDPVGAVSGICRRAVKLYAKACAEAKPNPVKLASWLFKLRLAWTTWPTVDISDFTSALAESGIAEYRRLLTESEADPATLRLMREQLARCTGDADTMIEALAEDLPSPKAYRAIVITLREANRMDEAIDWAEEGAAKDQSLTGLLVETYLAGGRGEDAVELRKAALREAPTRHCYACLRETATEAGTWSGLRSWALAVMAAAPAELVGALLDDDEVEEAWETAVKHDCVGVEVARRRGMTDPAEVVPAYRALVEASLSRGGRDAYREAGILLQELSKAAATSGESISGFVTELKARHARKPALLDELQRAGF
ncbi:SWIM zinc finger family protein [Actinophytocola oryzae]|uniref:Putative Zn finger protein n=1 Tax=Actinophytocola oryzae TaxID=502181 RepID=A0A4R7VBF8_9PSEU|nr:hypothetical protein [Actinophytocola oryzae]TDV46315.1 putative Zn finger protein [Actinophytocola oryzae]